MREEKHENEVAEASKNKKLLRRRPLYRQGTETSMIVDEKESFSVSLNTVFRASDEEIFERCGDDALQYLRFQRYIICYLVILMIFSIGVILPLNLHGNLVIIPITCILGHFDNDFNTTKIKKYIAR